jgi:two-component system, cell cycle response regulator
MTTMDARMQDFAPRSFAPADAESGSGHDSSLSILLVEDEGVVAQDLKESLTRLGYRVAGVAAEGVQAVRMAEELKPQLIVMDVGLNGDIDGIQAARMIDERLRVPVIFLTGQSDPDTLRRAISTGPLGYIVKPFQEVELRCAIEVAIHKHRADLATREREDALRRNAELLASLSLVDELTQLKNRRGFFELADQALKTARRERYTMGVFFLDLDGLKRINDTLGHLAGDQALRDTAQMLRQTFRESDILGRIGGDEFVALVHVAHGIDVLTQRLREHLREFNAARARPYRLDVSIGTTLVTVTSDEDIEALIARADAAMYEDKRALAPTR